MDQMLANWEIITGFFLPLVISVVIQSGWKRWMQALAMLAASAIVTVVQMYIRGDLTNVADTFAAVLSVAAATIVFYTGVWRPTGIANKVEEATSL